MEFKKKSGMTDTGQTIEIFARVIHKSTRKLQGRVKSISQKGGVAEWRALWRGEKIESSGGKSKSREGKPWEDSPAEKDSRDLGNAVKRTFEEHRLKK